MPMMIDKRNPVIPANGVISTKKLPILRNIRKETINRLKKKINQR